MILTLKNNLILNENDKFIVDKLSFHSARLYNSCNYVIKEYFKLNDSYLNYNEQYHIIKDNEHYSYLITDSAQQIHRIVDRNFKSFFSLLKLKNKGKYSADVKVPNYLPKEDGWSIFVAGRSARVKGNKVYIGLTKKFRDLYNINQKDLILDLPTNLNVTKLQQLQIKPTYGGKQYEILFCYEKHNEIKPLNKKNYISLDCGLDNLITTYDTINKKSFIFNGKPLKSVNQHYNKTKAKLQSSYEINKIKNKNTKRFIKLSEYRKNYINNYLNNTVSKVVNYCLNNDIGTLVIGDFKGIKQEINLGSKNNQNFVSIPFGILKRKLEAKCNYYGIDYILQEESYTSKCSALDLEEIGKKETYLGKRIKRGLFKTSEDVLIHADVNGCINILRKYLKSKFGGDLSLTDISGAINHPVRINPTKPIGI
jgi:IS605 OrfB family transposase